MPLWLQWVISTSVGSTEFSTSLHEHCSRNDRNSLRKSSFLGCPITSLRPSVSVQLKSPIMTTFIQVLDASRRASIVVVARVWSGGRYTDTRVFSNFPKETLTFTKFSPCTTSETVMSLLNTVMPACLSRHP